MNNIRISNVKKFFNDLLKLSYSYDQAMFITMETFNISLQELNQLIY